MGRRRRKPDKPDAQPRGQFAVEELERRILLSTLTGVDPDSDAWEPVEHPAPIEQDVGDPDSKADGADSEASALNATAERRLELVFVDTGVEGYEALVDDLRSSSSDGRSLEVFLLDAERDGIEQISDILADYEGVDAIHIVSHGSDGAVQLGNTWLQSDSLVLYSSDVAGWGEALGADADLLFYGCNLAGGESGEALVDSIAKLTGADVAASNDLTGAEALAGDWDLEYQAGSIESDTAVGARAQQSYLGVLANTAPIDLQTTTTTGGGLSLNEDAGNDVYFVADDGGGLLGGLNTVTIETTFSISTPATDVTPLLSYADGAHDEELALFIKNDGRIWFMADSAGAPYQSTTGSYNQLFDGEPHHVAVSWDSGSGAVVFYVDGALAESFTGYQTGSTITGTGELVFGQDQDSVLGGFRTIDIFSGVLYDVRIFDDVRTAGEISANYDATLPPTEPGMIANWNFGNLTTSGIVAEAVSGNNLTEQHVVAAGFSASVPELTLSVAEDAPNLTVIGSLIAIDPDAGDTFTYTLLDNAGGRFAIDGSTGEIAVADASLIDYETANSHDITARVTDAGGLTYDETFAIAVNPVNDAPVAVGESFVAVEGVPYAAGLGFDDLLMNDSDIEGDTLSVNTTPVSGPANGSLVLYADGTFLYTPNHNFNGTDSFVYEVLDGEGGSAQATATFTVQPREIRILFTTAADVNSSRVPGIDSWDAGDVLAIGDPNLSFEPVGSDGSILPQMDLESFAASADMTINGLHFVSNDLTIGGANSVDLQRGDLLFVSGADDVMTSLNSLAIGAGDVIVFRPNAVDDYGSGTFIHLLDQPGTEMTTGITLIEADVLVGDVTLQAGTFLFTQESVVEESSIFHFSADDVGAGTTTGTVSTLISSVDIGVQWNNFIGVMVISEDLYLDGTMVPAGSIVTTLANGDDTVGNNGIFVNEDEIFYLTVTTTTMGSGTTVADATVLFDGGDIGLNNSNKKMHSLAIIEEIRPVDNIDPAITLPSGPINYTEQGPATVLDAGATLLDPDSSDFDGGLLRVDLETTGSLNDRLAIRNEGTAAGQVGVVGSDVTYSGVVIGTFSGGSDGTDPLTVLFNANADVTAVQAVLRNITFENVSNDPSTNQRAAKFTLTDGDSGVSDPVVKVIVVNDVNAAPVISGADDLAGINEDAFTNGGTLVSDLISGWVTDADPGAVAGIAVVGVDDTNGTWEFSTDGGTAWTAFGSPSVDAARLLGADAGTFVRFVPDPDWNGTVTDGITFHAWDQTSGASGAAVDLVFSGTLRDEFGTVSYGNNDGTMAWTSDWVEFNDNGSAASGQLRVESGELHLDNQDLGTPESIARSADLSTAATATLTFDYDAYGYGGLDTAAFEVSNDGGATWTLLESMDVVGNLSGSKSYALDSYTTLTADMQVRFRIALGFGGPDQQITVDNVQIAYSGTGTGVSSSVSAATASSSITVAPVNDAPVRTAGTVADLTVAEDSGLTSLGLAGLGYGTGGGADEASQTLSYEVTVIPDPSTFGKIYLADGTTEVTTGFYSLTDLQGMQFEPAPDEAGGPSFFGFRVIDSGGTPNGGADTLAETIRIDITPVNDAPVLSLPGGPVNFTEGDGATIIDAAANLTDPDSVDFDGGVLTVDFTAGSTANDRLGIESVGGAGSISVTGSDVEYDFGGGPVAIGTVSGGTDGTTPLVITLNANADAVAVEALLASITYDNVSIAPSTADRIVRFVLSDGDGGTSDAVTEVITVSQVNSLPDLVMTNPPLAYTENDGPIPLDTGLTLADLDSSDFVGATVSITTGFVTGEDFLSFSDQLGITGAYDAATGILTLTGTASVADYETALRSVSYENTSESPDITQRHVTVVVDDGIDSGTDFRRINITSVNDAPTISLINTTTNFPENTDTTVRIKVADIVVSDDDLGTNDLTLTGADAGLFEIDTGVLYLKAGTSLDFDANPMLDVTVEVDDAALPATPEDSAALAITVTDINAAPTVALSNVTTTFPENTDTTARIKVADITVTDDATGTNVLTLTGTDAALFEIDTGVLYLKAGTSLDFDANPMLDVTVEVDDAALPATPEDSAALAITVTDINAAPTVALSNVTTTFPENTDTTSRIKVADITVTDDATGTNVLTLTGTDAALFEIDTGVLYLKAGTSLDFDANPMLDVTVEVDDAALPATPEDSAALAITVTDINAAPTVALSNVTTTFPENTDTTARIKVADITVTDDATGTNVLTLTGADALLFEIDAGVLYLQAGTVLDFDANPMLDVTVEVDDAALPATPEDSAALAITVTDINAAPTVALSNVTTTFPENTDTTARIKVADITVTDDATGTNVLTLTGTDAALFEIDTGVLYLKAGTSLDFETNPMLDVTVEVDDAALPATPEDSAALAITVTDINAAPTVALSNVTTTFPENTDTTARIKVADITVTDDATGTNVLTLTGTDAALFEIDTGVLYLKAGTSLDFDANPMLDVTVEVDDAALPATPEDSAALAITVTDINAAPTVALSNVTTTFPENTDTTARIKVADITVTDDATGTNVLTLTGADALLFEIDAGVLYLQAGTVLDFDANPMLDVTVEVDDAALPATPEDSAALAITVTDINAAPTVALSNVTTTFPENTDTTARIKVADITVTDDATGTNVLTLTGTDAALFEIDTGVLYLKAGTSLDFETNPMLDVTVEVDDAALVGSPEDSAALAITVTDINAAPTVALSNVTTTFPENTDTTARIKVADITVTDDATGTNVLTLTGADALLFEIDAGVLYLQAGTVLDFDANPMLDVTVEVDDAALPATPEDSAALAITVTDINAAPTVALSNVTTTFPENTDTTARIKVADITVTDDATGTNVLTLTGADALLFEIDAGVLYLQAGTVLDFDANPMLDVTVEVDDAALVGSPEDSAALAITVTDINAAPTVALSNVTTTFPENTDTTSRIKVADITVTDDATGTNVLSLTGTDAALFEIDTGVLYLKAGTSLDFDANPMLDVTVEVDDAALVGSPEDSAALAITVTDINAAPTVALSNVTTTFPENTDTTARIKVADITVTDDATGTNVLTLTGTDAALFEIDTGVLYLKAGTSLDFDANPMLDVTVEVDDAALVGSPEDSAALAITVTDINAAPTVALSNVTTTFPENTDTTARIKVADITVTDDATGTNVLTLTGADALLFEIDAGVLYLQAGTVLDFDANPMLDVTVEVDDAALPATPEDSAALAITVTDINAAPTVALSNVTTTFPENTDTTARIKVADITVTDDATGTNVLTLTGTDAALFEIDTGVLYLKAGTSLDFDANPMLDVTVEVDDAALPATPEDSAALAITVTDINAAPTVALSNVTTTFPENTDTTARIKVADITVTDDATGTNVLTLTGTDAALFEIDTGVLYLKAGTSLDFDANPMLDVTVEVDDAALPATPEDSAALAITVTDINAAPTVALSNVTTTFPENTDTTARIKVADITVTDDATGTNVLTLTGADALLFEIDAGVLYLQAGTVLDFDANPMLDVTVEVDDAALPATPEDSAALAITVTDINAAPTVALSNVTTTFPENTDTTARIKVADITVTDDATGTNVLTLTGTDAALFEIDTGVLYLKAGTSLDFDANPMLDVTVEVDDAALPATPEDSAALAITVTDINAAPTVALSNVTTTFPENTDTTARIKVADITVTDDATGTNVLTLTGTDAALFEIDTGVLYLKAGTSLDFDANPMLDVTVEVDDAALPATPEDSAALAITVTDINAAPTVALSNVTTTFPENTDTTARIKVADITVTDDATGTNVLTLTGADALLFEIDAGVLYLQAGTVLDFDANPMLDVTVEVDDAALPATPEDSAALAITVTDINAAPTVALSNVTTTFPENTDTTARIKVADITVTDDATGTNVLTLTGTDAALFEIDTGVLYLKAGTSLDFDANPMLDVTVEVDDAALPATPEDSAALAITVTDINAAPTVALSNVTTTFPENTDTTARIKVADITVTDDATGTNVLTLTGTDAALFEIDTGVLYLKAGTSLDFDANPMLDVTVEVDDAALPATPEDSAALAITVTDINAAPTVALSNVTTTFPENTDTTARIKVADITVTDDATGTNVLTLTGTDAALFEIDTGVLYLKAGTSLDFDANPMLDVTVEVDDAALPATPEDSAALAITVTDINAAPTVALSNVTTTFPENTDTTARIKVADITVTDDATGTNVLTLTGADALLFEIDAGVLYLQAGTVLDFDANPMLDVTVEVDDAALVGSPEDSAALAITVTDINAAPTVALSNVTTTFPENTDTTARIKVADITVTDDATGTNVLTLTGTDAALFEIDTGVLYLKAGTSLDFDANPMLDVTVEVDDAALPATPEDSAALAITVTDINAAPTVALSNVTTTFPENTDTTARIKVADITVTDDATGTNVLTLTGADALLFEIDTGVLYLKAGTALDFETNPILDVTVELDDAALPATPEDSEVLAITVTNVNEAPVIDLDADDSAGETLSDFAMVWTEGGGPVVIADIDATLLDVDSAMLGSLNVAISNLLDSGFELLSADTSGTNITATYDSALGVLELSGTDSVANYEQVLRTITYDNQSHTPAVSDRSIEFFAGDGLSFSNVATATVSVTPTDDAPVLENNRLTISEGDTVSLTASDLSASDVDSDPSSLGFTVTSIEHGRFERLGAPGTAITSFDQADIANGQVRFVHDGSEFAPSYQVTVSDASSNVGPALVTVTFTNVNDAPVSVGDSYLGSEDSVLTTSADEGVLVGDSDEEAQPLVAILVSGPSSAANFTLNSDGSFDYTPMQDFFGADSFSYRASDGEAASGIATVTITVSPVNDVPELLNNRLSVAPGDVVALTTENLGAADVDHAAADLEFDVAAVENGHFERAGEPDQSITNFAQSEVAAGEIYFVHDGSLFAPSYEVMVSDGDLTAGPYLADVTFNSLVNSDPLDPNPDPDEPPPTDSLGDPLPPPASEPLPEDATLPDGEEEPAPDPEEPQPEDGFRRVTWFPAGSSKDPTFERTYDELPTLERSTAMLEAPEDDDSLSKRLGDHEQAEASRMLALSDLWRVLEQMRTDMEQSGEEDAAETETLVAAAEGLSLAFSSGLLLLLMRSSSLWAVALSALPVWRRVDPLAVLAITAEERRKLERDLRKAEQQEDTAGLGLGRVLDSTEEDEEPDEKEEAGRSVGALERERPDERA